MGRTLFILVFFSIAFSFFQFVNHPKPPANEALPAIQLDYQKRLTTFLNSVTDYERAVQLFADQKLSVAELQRQHIETRSAFKAIEFWLEYFDREAVKKYINGAPLPSLEPKVPEINIIEPAGLQTLDELVFAANSMDHSVDIQRLVENLAKATRSTVAYQRTITFQHRFFFEAARQELLRILTLGVTGFDTPASGQAIEEALVAFQSVKNAWKHYSNLVAKENPDLAVEVDQFFESGVQLISENSDFDTFDRLTFTRTVINPLYGALLKAQRALHVETIDEVNPQSQPINYLTESIFDAELFNKNYFANVTTQEFSTQRVALGRLLFFDPILSGNNERACASCHDPKKAFTDGLDRSMAMNMSGKIQRNSPTLINSLFAERYFYDLREPLLERQIKHVVLDEKEFGTDFFELTDKLKQSEEYKRLFAEAYPDQPNYQISKWSVSNALACYVASLNSFNSPVDKYIRGEIEDLAPEVAQGFNIFMGKGACGTCHFAPTFSGLVPPNFLESESEVLGVPSAEDSTRIDADLGRFASYRAIDQAPFYRHSFKTTTVRNVALTAPYMHNGIYQTLAEVVDFYNHGGGEGLGLEVEYQTLPFDSLALDAYEKDALIAFMKALTDTTNLTTVPAALPQFEQHPTWNARVIGGEY